MNVEFRVITPCNTFLLAHSLFDSIPLLLQLDYPRWMIIHFPSALVPLTLRPLPS
jgi:hypothetical protein